MRATGPATDALDREVMDRLVRLGGQAFLIEMMELFLSHAPARLAAARTAADGADAAGLYQAAHSLKATAAHLGAVALRAAAERVEERAMAGDAEFLAPLLDELERAHEEACREIELERDRRKGSHGQD